MESLNEDYDFCVDKFAIEDSVVDQIKNGFYGHVDDNVECFTLCFFERAGFMDANAKLNEDFLLEKVKAIMPEETALTLYLKCSDDIGKNACNTAFLFYKCFRE